MLYPLCTMHYAVSVSTLHYALCCIHSALCTMLYSLCTTVYTIHFPAVAAVTCSSAAVQQCSSAAVRSEAVQCSAVQQSRATGLVSFPAPVTAGGAELSEHWETLPRACTALHCAALHCTALHCTALHCTALHCTA
jgi:hypothetical protein